MASEGSSQHQGCSQAMTSAVVHTSQIVGIGSRLEQEYRLLFRPCMPQQSHHGAIAFWCSCVYSTLPPSNISSAMPGNPVPVTCWFCVQALGVLPPRLFDTHRGPSVGRAWRHSRSGCPGSRENTGIKRLFSSMDKEPPWVAAETNFLLQM